MFLEITNATLAAVRPNQCRQHISVQIHLFCFYATCGLRLRYQVSLKPHNAPLFSQMPANFKKHNSRCYQKMLEQSTINRSHISPICIQICNSDTAELDAEVAVSANAKTLS